MAIPVLKLNLAPAPSLWRENHEILGWSAVGAGAVLLAGTLSYATWNYVKAAREARRIVSFTADAQKVAREQTQLVSELRSLDVSKEMPRWKLAERILLERSLPWSRLTAELERSLVQDVRIKSLQRTRGSDQTVQLGIKGEAKNREAEVKFIEKLQQNGLFTQVLLEREAERQGGGLDFEVKLPTTTAPKAYEPLPEPEWSNSSPQRPLPVSAPAPPSRPSASGGALPGANGRAGDSRPAGRAEAMRQEAERARGADGQRRQRAEEMRRSGESDPYDGPPQSGTVNRPNQNPAPAPAPMPRKNQP